MQDEKSSSGRERAFYPQTVKNLIQFQFYLKAKVAFDNSTRKIKVTCEK